MSGRLRRRLVLNVGLAALGLAFGAGIIREITHVRPLPPAPQARGTAVPAAGAATPTLEGRPPNDRPTYGVIAARNLFSASRTEVVAAAPSSSVPKPVLHGVVVDGAKSRAYLEDPAAKRVFGYAVGDAVGGGRLEQVTDDRIVIRRPEGVIEVPLQDPSKPKTATPSAAAPAQGAAPPVQTQDGQSGAPVPVPPQLRRPPGPAGQSSQ
jgi:hypothetical protein